MEYYTYAYLREDGTPYYIGKGKGKRINQKCRRLFNLPPKGRRIFLKQNLTEEEAFRHEKYMIAVFGRKDLGTGILRNFTNGGEGASGIKCSEQSRKKMSEAKRGKTLPEETRKKMSLSKKGKKWGYHSEEAKERLIQRHYKIWKFISPTGETVEEYTTLSEFCRKYSLDRVRLGKLTKEKIKQYKGWRFISSSSGG